MSKYMNKYTKLCDSYDRINHDLHENKYNINILINVEENHLSAIYDGHRVCKIKEIDYSKYSSMSDDRIYCIEFEDGFFGGWCRPSIQRCRSTGIVVYHIEQRIIYYNNKKKQEVKNMAKRRFIVEKMEVVQRCREPDVINMTVRQEPDGLIPKTGKELKALIESLDPDNLSSDNRINVNVSDHVLDATIYAMAARGSGKTRYTLELMKDLAKRVNNGIKDVIFNDPATIVFWVDGSKTVVKCQPGETFDPEKGLAMAISKKVLGNDYGYYETFAKHVGRYNKKHKEK